MEEAVEQWREREEYVDDPGLRLHLHHLRPERRGDGGGGVHVDGERSSPFDRAVNLILKKVARPSVPPPRGGREGIPGRREASATIQHAESADLSSVSSFVIARSCLVSTWIINSLRLRILGIIYHMGTDRGGTAD